MDEQMDGLPDIERTENEQANHSVNEQQLDAERIFDSEASWFSDRQVHRRRPKKANQIISQLLAKKGFNQNESLQQIQSTWESLLDERFRGQTRATGIRGGKLIVVVKNAVIHQELAFQKTELINELNNTPIGNRIKDIRIQIGVV